MECNKEEAVKAKEMAEQKLQSRDFKGAQKIALKAQQLFPDLENISQILTVCEVHCSAEVEFSGEMDWYGILRIHPTADESAIKKQYRKLALVLHPDKNKFAGAEAAFKLIGEAQRTLLDPAKRQLYDIKRNAKVKNKTIPRQPAHQARDSRANFSPVNINQQQPHPSFEATQTFWTMCSSCGLRFEYYRSALNKTIRCQNCSKAFVAYALNANAVPSVVNLGHQWTNSGVPPPQIPVPQMNSFNHQSQHGSVPYGAGLHGNTSRMQGVNSDQRGGHANRSTDAKVNFKGTSANEVKFSNADSAKVDQSEHAAKSSNAKTGQKRGRKVVTESSDSDSSDSEVVPFDMKYESTEAPRRSSRRRENVIYNEDGSEDDDVFSNPSCKRSRDNMTDMDNDKVQGKQEKHILREEKLSNGTKKVKEDAMKGGNEGTSTKEKSGQGTGSSASSDFENLENHQQTFNYPDPEFFDFNSIRNANRFAVDQIWAIYDNVDGMPRFYARIRKIQGPGFRLQFTWLEHNPVSEAEIAWSDEELPLACGNYRLGNSESTKDQLMFSHVISGNKGKKNSYDIYPRTGEVWALFKNWNISWSSDADSHRLYEYEVVEILSDFTEGSGISVIPLVMIAGFVSLFIRANGASSVIPSNEILKFSHNVPFHKLTGTEREGLPPGCLELDCASLPINFSELFPSVSLDAFVGSANVTADKESGSPRKEKDCWTSQDLHPSAAKADLETNQASGSHHPEVQKNVPRQTHQPDEIHANKKYNENNGNNSEGLNEKNAVEIDSLSPEPASPMTYVLPETDFHDFDDEKSIEKFEQGQIWALYSDIDQFPKYYGYIKKVDIGECEVHIKWLESCCQQEEEQRWSDKDIPIGCGIFKVDRQSAVYDTTDTFSHLVVAEGITKTQYKILPKVHEIWALYKNWRVGWNKSDFENCEYVVVEIFEDFGSGMKVNILTKKDGYKSVYCRQMEGITACTMTIPASEYLRFSHRIPAFLLTNESGGKLMDCWELDPASVPQILLSSSSE